MSQSQIPGRGAFGTRNDEPRTISDSDEIGTVLEAFEDVDCRTILAATSDDALTVTEITERFDIAQSTAYRKVEALVDADLLSESIRIRSSGSHVSTYSCAVEDVTLTVESGSGVEVSLTSSDSGAASPSDPYRYEG